LAFFPKKSGKFATKHSFLIFTPKMKPLGHRHNTGFGESIFVEKIQLSFTQIDRTLL
jgi:hypothetical protein